MKETDRSAILRIFQKWDPLDHGGHMVTIEQEAEPGFDRKVLRFRFDHDGNLLDFNAFTRSGIAEYE